MTNTILNETAEEIKHNRSEIKAKNAKLAARHLRMLNNAVKEIVTAADPEWRQIKSRGYYNLLAVVHVNGAEGALV